MYELSLIFALACYLGVVFWYSRSGAFSAFHPLTWYLAFHGLVFVFRPILGYFLQYNIIYLAYRFNPTMDVKITAILVSTLGLCAFAFSCLYSGGVPMGFNNTVSSRDRSFYKSSFITVCVICLPFAIYSLYLSWYYASTTGVANDGMIYNRDTGGFYNTRGNGYLTDAQLMLATLSAAFAWLNRFRLFSLLPLLLFAILRAGMGSRGVFITALATTGLLWLYDRRKRFPALRLILGIALVAPIFGYLGVDRGSAIRRAISTDTYSVTFDRRESSEKLMEGMDFGNLEFLEYIIYVVPEKSGTYDYFLDNLQLFTEPIPRVLWKGKPMGEPFPRIFMFRYGTPTGMTHSLPGEGWYALGWLGVIIWCGLWGWGLGAIYRRFAAGPQTSYQILAYTAFVPILVIAFRDGSVMTIFRQGIFFMAPILLWNMLSGGLLSARLRAKVTGSIDRNSRRGVTLGKDGLEHLPAAVRRRRMALMQARTE